MKVLALDLGSRRVGLAESDEMGWMANARPYIDFVSDEDFALRLKVVLEEKKPACVVVGYPKTMSGEAGIAAKNIEKKVDFLRSRFPETRFELWDERLTTKAAEVYLRESGQSKAKRKARVDSLSAQILLQNYLDFQSASKKGTA